ncbi:MAG: hypothetical protein WBA68_13055 [Alteraurantiacibacter sp.]
MHVFVLNTGRCGSLTFANACAPIVNYSAAHESCSKLLGEAHFDYPDNHIEVDNRLSWFLGSLQKRFGDDAAYVHLSRDPDAVARSFNRRTEKAESIIHAYHHVILPGDKGEEHDPIDFCRDYVRTVNNNIRAFLADKSRKVNVSIEDPHQGFAQFWDMIGAKGDFDEAMSILTQVHHAHGSPKLKRKSRLTLTRAVREPGAALDKIRRVYTKFPQFIRRA